MIARYRVLSSRLRADMDAIERVAERAETGLDRAARYGEDRDYFLAAAALDLHGVYAGLERLFELIAREVDGDRPSGGGWRRELLAQMALTVRDVRPAVLSQETRTSLTAYLDFRHVVRNVYTLDLQPERIVTLVRGLRTTLGLVRRDLDAFADFLDTLAAADEA